MNTYSEGPDPRNIPSRFALRAYTTSPAPPPCQETSFERPSPIRNKRALEIKKILFNAPRACFIFNSSLELYELRRLFPSGWTSVYFQLNIA